MSDRAAAVVSRALLLPADRVDGHDRAAAEHQKQQEGRECQTQESSSLALRARGVLRRDGCDLLNVDRESAGPVHAVPQLRADLGNAVAEAFRRVAGEVTLSAMSQTQGGERELGLRGGLVLLLILWVGLGRLFRANTFVGLRRQSLDNDVDLPGAQQ
jgi:hypothetical protein